MLVLSRRRDESIIIDDDIRITVVDIRGDKVRLGIEAPKSTSVHRKEIYDAIIDGNVRDGVNGLEEKTDDIAEIGGNVNNGINGANGYDGRIGYCQLY